MSLSPDEQRQALDNFGDAEVETGTDEAAIALSGLAQDAWDALPELDRALWRTKAFESAGA